jgi:lysozyme
MRAIPRKAVTFVSKWEGFRSEAYLCSAGQPTIGYGHTEGVSLQTPPITKAQALTLLAKDMEVARGKLYGVVKPAIIDELTENQWATLLSFAFNLGAGKSWTIWKRLNARQFDQVPQELAKFVNAGGRKVQGLVNRRAAEQVLWSTDEPGSTDEPVPSSVTRGAGVTPPTPADPAPITQSKTFWTGGTVAAAGVVSGAQQIQALAAPQAANNELVANLASIAAFLIVAGGIAIMVFRWLGKREARR